MSIFIQKTLEFLINLHSTKNFNRYRKSIQVVLVYSTNVRSFEGLHDNLFLYHDYLELISSVHTILLSCFVDSAVFN